MEGDLIYSFPREFLCIKKKALAVGGVYIQINWDFLFYWRKGFVRESYPAAR